MTKIASVRENLSRVSSLQLPFQPHVSYATLSFDFETKPKQRLKENKRHQVNTMEQMSFMSWRVNMKHSAMIPSVSCLRKLTDL